MKDTGINKSINELQRDICENYGATGKSMEDVWIWATPEKYKLCESDV